MGSKKGTHHWLTLITAAVVIAVLVYLFRPQPIAVDIAPVERREMVVTIDEEAKTQVSEAYLVSAPVHGQLLRVTVEAGDRVEQGKSVVARMIPVSPEMLDIRTQEQARAAVDIAKASLTMAQANLKRLVAEQELAQLELNRLIKLKKNNLAAKAELDRAEKNLSASKAALEAGRSAITMRYAELASAEATLINFTQNNHATADTQAVDILAPISGQVLRVQQKSASPLQAGTPILEIGNIEQDLEVKVELLSTDAVNVNKGDKVIIENWGGKEVLNGLVDRIEPLAFTKFSALGVEEQRVNVIIKFADSAKHYRNLGHGYRVDTRIIIWQQDNVLTLPSSALFRQQQRWAVYKVVGNRAQLNWVEVGQQNGQHFEIVSGLDENDRVVLYPDETVSEGIRIKARVVD